MDVGAYLARIGIEAPVELTLEALEQLQRAHLTAVQFENLDVFYRRGVSTEPSWSVPKILQRGRGRWRYELNGAFATLLEGHACERECSCPVHRVWAEAREKIQEVFGRKSLADLAREQAQRERVLGQKGDDCR